MYNRIMKTLTISLPDDSIEMLGRLASDLEISKTATIRRAIRLLDIIESKIAAGEKIFAENPKSGLGTKVEIVFT